LEEREKIFYSFGKQTPRKKFRGKLKCDFHPIATIS
jgi:hypothetical protein